MGTAAAALGDWREPLVFPWMATRGQERDPRLRVNPVVVARGAQSRDGAGSPEAEGVPWRIARIHNRLGTPALLALRLYTRVLQGAARELV